MLATLLETKDPTTSWISSLPNTTESVGYRGTQDY